MSNHISFISPYCVLDHSSGASQSIRTMLHAMQKIGWKASSLSSSCLDNNHGLPNKMVDLLKKRGEKPLLVKDQSVTHIIFNSSSHRRHELKAREDARLFSYTQHFLDKNKPTHVIAFGGMLFEQLLPYELKKRKIKSCMYLVNENYSNAGNFFENFDFILTDSEATRSIYLKHAPNIKNIGKFIGADKLVKYEAQERKYITLINPSPEKGVEIFIQIIEKLEAEQPNKYNFQIVESRGNWLAALKLFNRNSETFKNVKVIPFQGKMDYVYKSSKLILLPSLWHESGSRVAVEAVMNHIPVIATDSGGTREMLRGTGVILEKPVTDRKAKYKLPSDYDTKPWCDAIKELMDDPKNYGNMVKKCKKAAEYYEISESAKRLEQILLNHS